jgi:hypothetical protein
MQVMLAVHYLHFALLEGSALTAPHLRLLLLHLASLRHSPVLQPSHPKHALPHMCVRGLLDDLWSQLEEPGTPGEKLEEPGTPGEKGCKMNLELTGTDVQE